MAEEFADDLAGFIENTDPVDSDAADAGSLGRGSDQPLPQFSGARKDDRAVMGDRSLVVAVASARQRGVGEREQHAAMAGAESIEHGGADSHAEAGAAGRGFQQFDSEVPADAVAAQHGAAGGFSGCQRYSVTHRFSRPATRPLSKQVDYACFYVLN